MIATRTKPDDIRIERQIITGLIISTRFIADIEQIYKQGSLQTPYAQTVARWCFDYFEKYKIAPGRNIEDIFREQRKISLDPDTADLIESFLSSISQEYVKSEEVFNSGYIADKAEKHLRSVSLKNLIGDIGQAVKGGRIEDAEALVKGYERVARQKTKGIDPINDKEAISRALNPEETGDRLFKMPGAVGDLFGYFKRGELFSFVGSSGTGKTWWLMSVALWGLLAGYNVLFASLEMSEDEMIRRIQHWVNGLPTKKWSGKMSIPVFDCVKNQNNKCREECRIKLTDDDNELPTFEQQPRGYKPCAICRDKNKSRYEMTYWYKEVTKKELTIESAFRKREAIERSALIRGNNFKLVAFPHGKISMNEFETYLYNYEHYENFIPDIIITDYADKFQLDKGQQRRHSIADVWGAHKAIAQVKNAWVCTASQSNTARTGRDIKQGDWEESIAKLNIVNGAMAINMSPEEKLDGIMRASALKIRDDDFSTLAQVMVLHQLKIGRPYLDSYKMKYEPKKF